MIQNPFGGVSVESLSTLYTANDSVPFSYQRYYDSQSTVFYSEQISQSASSGCGSEHVFQDDQDTFSILDDSLRSSGPDGTTNSYEESDRQLDIYREALKRNNANVRRQRWQTWINRTVDISDETHYSRSVDSRTAIDLDGRRFVISPNCPIHKAAYQASIPRKIRFQCSTGGDESVQSTVTNQLFDITDHDSSSVFAKLVRQKRIDLLPRSTRDLYEKEKGKLQRNLYIISFSFLFLITSFQGMQNLQTTINGQNALGSLSLAVVYVGLVVSCLFVPPYLLNRLGCKLTLVTAMCMHSLYVLINFAPRWLSLVPASLMVGVSCGPLFAAKSKYLTEIGLRYARINFEPANVAVTRFFGIFFMITNMGQVTGNVISSAIIHLLREDPFPIADQVETSCGHYFDPFGNLSQAATSNLQRPSDRAINSVIGIFFSCTLIGSLLIVAFLNQLRRDHIQSKERPSFKPEVFQNTIKRLRTPKPLLLIPLTIFNGMEQAFIIGTFTKAYISCCLGIENVGYVMTWFGVCTAVCSLLFGPLMQLFGRHPLFVFAAVVDMLMIFTLLIWPPNPADTALFYVVAASWGMADGVWNTQINGLWVVLFDQNLEVAFANYRLWESVGFIIAYSYTSFLHTETSLCILLVMLLVGMMGYGLIEAWDMIGISAKQLRVATKGLWSDKRRKISSHKNLLNEIQLQTVSGSLKYRKKLMQELRL